MQCAFLDAVDLASAELNYSPVHLGLIDVRQHAGTEQVNSDVRVTTSRFLEPLAFFAGVWME